MNKNQTYNYIKGYLASTYDIDFSPYFSLIYNNIRFFFHLERIVFRKFEKNDYLKYSKHKTINTINYRIIYFIKGSNCIILNNKIFKCKTGTLLLLSPGLQPSNTPKIKGECEQIVFSFSLIDNNNNHLDIPFDKILEELIPQNSFNQNIIYNLNDYYQSIFLESFDNFFYSIDRQLSKEDSFSNILAIVSKLYEIFNLIARIKEPSKPNIPNELKKTISFMKRNLDKKISIDDLSKEASLSKTHYQFLFKKYYAKTPIQFLYELRMKKACFLLSETLLSCQKISSIVGYSNQYYFSKKFKEYNNISPINFRKNNNL